VLRTSHLTGMFTDLGIAMGQRWRGAAFDPRRTRLCVAVIGAFIAGGACGALLFGSCSGRALWLPALVVLAMATWTGVRLRPPQGRSPPAA
jgi:uncharacterized membrane protein YoaK (UPF0700 family)